MSSLAISSTHHSVKDSVKQSIADVGNDKTAGAPDIITSDIELGTFGSIAADEITTGDINLTTDITLTESGPATGDPCMLSTHMGLADLR